MDAGFGRKYLAALCYADDLTLISPTIHGLQAMLQICEDFANDFGMKYNSTKTVCMMFARKLSTVEPAIWLCGNKLAWVPKVKLLGNILLHNLSEAAEITMKKGDMVGRTNLLLATLSGAPDKVIKEVFQKQVCHMYGSQAWDLRDPVIMDFHTMWNRCARRIMKLPNKTHTRFLPYLICMDHSITQVAKRTKTIVNNMLISKNETVKFLANKGLRSMDSLIGSNLNKTKQVAVKLQCTDEDLCVIELLKDIKKMTLVNFDKYELFQIFKFFCEN